MGHRSKEIGIIGAGNVGRALAGSIAKAGYSVAVSSAGREGAQLVAKETGARAADSNQEAVDGADVVVLAVPHTALDSIIRELGESLNGKILVDVTNPMKSDLTGPKHDAEAEAELIQARVPAARVVKAFNTVFAARQAEPVVDGVQLDAFVAGDDDEAKAAVLELAERIGFRPGDAGPLAMARALEGMALLNVSLQIRNGWSWQTGWKLVGPTQ